MSMKGGYKIINLGGVDVSGGAVIPGTYAAIEGNHCKTLVLSGLVTQPGTVLDDAPVNFRNVGGEYVGMYSATMTGPTEVTMTYVKVEDNDTVTALALKGTLQSAIL